MATPKYEGMLFGNDITTEDINMQKVPQFLRTRAEMEKGIDEFKRSTFDPFLEEQFGYVSPTRQLEKLGEGVDFSSDEDLEKRFNAMWQINPQSAVNWIKTIRPEVDAVRKKAAKGTGLSTAMQTIREFGLYGNPDTENEDFVPCDIMAKPGDPTYRKGCFADALKLAKEYKRTTAAEAGGIAYQKGVATRWNKEAETYQNKREDARTKINLAQQNLSILDGGNVYMGPLAGFINYANKIGAMFGNETAATSAAEAQQFITTNLGFVMSWIKGTKGAISEKEMDLFFDATANITNPELANKLILQSIVKSAEYVQKEAEEFSRWEAEQKEKARKFKNYNYVPEMSEWYKHLAEWKKTNGLDDYFKNMTVKAQGLSSSPSGSSSESIDKEIESDGVVFKIKKAK